MSFCFYIFHHGLSCELHCAMCGRRVERGKPEHCIAVLSQGGREEAKEEGKDREIKREGHEE